LGFDRQFLQFTQQYALSTEDKKQAVIFIRHLLKNQDETIKIDAINLINKIIDEFSTEKFQKKTADISAHERFISSLIGALTNHKTQHSQMQIPPYFTILILNLG